VKDRLRCSYPGSQVERSVWTLLVEVADVDAKDVLELAAPEDQQTVEALPAHAADPALSVGVRIRRLDRWVPKTRFHALASREADPVG
jgi:hypothetical protein